MKPVEKGKEDFISAHDGGFTFKLEKTSADNPEREKLIGIMGRGLRYWLSSPLGRRTKI